MSSGHELDWRWESPFTLAHDRLAEADRRRMEWLDRELHLRCRYCSRPIPRSHHVTCGRNECVSKREREVNRLWRKKNRDHT